MAQCLAIDGSPGIKVRAQYFDTFTTGHEHEAITRYEDGVRARR